MAKALEDESGKALIIGNEVVYPPWKVGEKAFFFNAEQTRFLWALQKYGGNIEQAAEFVAKPVEWATHFLASKKFREFKASKIKAASVRNGDLVESWWEFGIDGARGFKEFYVAVCHLCHGKSEYSVPEAELARQDDMSFCATCKYCLQPVEIEYQREEFKPTREMVQIWQELGNRLSPKIERVHHEFSKETFLFSPKAEPA